MTKTELCDIGTTTLDQINLSDINLDEVKYDLNMNQVSGTEFAC